MTVEERRGNVAGDNGASKDKFPVGMRVLAVDDDPTCLKLLETLLRRCDYHVTTTAQAVMALKMLRENKDKFDLVISDVHMPDMDGFKLLELVGLEMDLPVIMLSAISDTKAVMKGITHGACDYLLKPVRIEELKNIWQHVIRRRKVDHREQNSIHGDEGQKAHQGVVEGGPVSVTAGTADANGKLGKKRKDQNDEDDDDCEDNGHGDDPSAQKKPRVVWSVELHRKFVAAVNQLGIDKAVPKRILDLMNVERLTRENVASHLQKYRLYLKRISNVASQQANLAAALGAKDLSYLHMGSLDGIGDFHPLSGSVQLPKATISSFQGSGVLGRLNSPTSLGLRGLNSSGMIQLGRPQNSGSSANDLGNLHQATHPGNSHGTIFQGIPHPFELNRLQTNKAISCVSGLSSPVNDSTLFAVTQQQQLTGIRGFSDNGVSSCSSSNSFLSIPNTPLLQGQPQWELSGGLGSQASVTMATLNTEPFIANINSSGLPDNGRSNNNWENATPLAGYSTNPSSMDAFNHSDMSLVNIPSISSNVEVNPFNVSSSSMAIEAPPHESLLGRDLQCQNSSLGVTVSMRSMSGEVTENLKLSNSGSMSNNIGQSMKYVQKQLEDHKQDYNCNPNIVSNSSMNSLLPNHGGVGNMNHGLGQSSAVSSRKVDIAMMGQSNLANSFNMQECDAGKLNADGPMKFSEDYYLDHMKLPESFNPNSCNPFDDLMSAVIKREQDEVPLVDGDIGCDAFPLGTCM